MHIVAHEATPILGITPRKNPRSPFSFQISLAVEIIVGFGPDDEALALIACMSTLMTSKGWFQQLSAPPIVEAAIFSGTPSFPPCAFPRIRRIWPSANLEMPMRDAHPVICLIATALTPLFTPRMPCVRMMLKKVSMVPGTRTPACADFLRVTSTVFIHVVMPIVKYD